MGNEDAGLSFLSEARPYLSHIQQVTTEILLRQQHAKVNNNGFEYWIGDLDLMYIWCHLEICTFPLIFS